MKNLVLASVLGTLAGAFAIPRIGGPVHYQLTRPYSLYALVPSTNQVPSTVNLGIAPLDFVLTDVMFTADGAWFRARVLVNGSVAFCCGSHSPSCADGSTHMTTGVFIPAGSSIAFQVDNTTQGMNVPAGEVTLAGYVQ